MRTVEIALESHQIPRGMDCRLESLCMDLQSPLPDLISSC